MTFIAAFNAMDASPSNPQTLQCAGTQPVVYGSGDPGNDPLTVGAGAEAHVSCHNRSVGEP